MKKFIYFFLFLIFIVVAAFEFYIWHSKAYPIENYENIWKTDRKLPENLALNSYLSGNIAKKEHHINKALMAYKHVLNQEPINTTLLKDFYVLAMFQGTPDMVLPYLDKIPSAMRITLFSDYLKAARLFQENSDELLTFLKNKPTQKADRVILPLIRSWYAAKINDKKAAIENLRSLQGKQLSYVLGYHEFLLGTYFNDESLQKSGLNKIQDKKLSALGYFPLLKNYAQKDQTWFDTPLYQQFQEMERLYPATAELIQTFGQNEITPETGLAETFYFLASEGTSGLFSREDAVFLNSIALSLQPDKNLALVWGSELAQAFNFPYISIDFYKRIHPKSATILFKEAAILLLNEQDREAEEILQALYQTNATHIPLLTLMGQHYSNTKQTEKALEIYNHLIPLLEKTPQNKPLAQAHVARANLYQQINQKSEMISDLEKAQILMPDDAMLQNDIGYHYLEAGKIDEGFQLIQKAYHLHPKDPYILDSLAFAYYKKDQPQIALIYAEKALDRLPQSSLINMHLGDIYWATGRLREAGFQYKKALDLKDDLSPEIEQQIQQKIAQLKAP